MNTEKQNPTHIYLHGFISCNLMYKKLWFRKLWEGGNISNFTGWCDFGEAAQRVTAIFPYKLKGRENTELPLQGHHLKIYGT